MSINGKIISGVRWIIDSTGALIGYRNPAQDVDAPFPSGTYPALDVQNRVASVAMPTTPAVLIPDTVVVSSGGMLYEPLTGIMTVPESRAYSFIISLNLSVPGARSIYGYAEVDTGGGFAPSQYSCRRIAINAAIDGQVVFVSRNIFPAGTRLRFMIWSSASATAQTTDAPSTPPGTVTVPAWRILVAS